MRGINAEPPLSKINLHGVVQMAERAIRDASRPVLISRNHALRIQKAYQRWKKKKPESETGPLPHPAEFEPAHPLFLESVTKRVKQALERKIGPEEDVVPLLSVRTRNIPIFDEALSRTFEGIEHDDAFDSKFLLRNLTEELNTAVKAVCNKENENRAALNMESPHVIDHDDLMAFILKRLISQRQVDMSIRVTDNKKIIMTYAFFNRIFLPIFISRLGKDKAIFLLELIKGYCDPKTESVTMLSLIAACEEFHRRN